MNLKRFVYLGYYFKQLDWSKFNAFLTYTQQQTQQSKLGLLMDIIKASLRHNVSILDYFYFRFFEKDETERSQYAGTGFMYEYQLKMNPPASRSVLENKIEFNSAYRQFVRRMAFSFSDLDKESSKERLLSNESGKIVLKGATGQVGAEVGVFSISEFAGQDLSDFMTREGFDLAEEYVQQHPDINALSPSGLNTVRIFSQLDDQGGFQCLGARLRISVNSQVDNMAAGNLAAPVNERTGIVNGPAVYSDITKTQETIHPITNEKIIGFQIPFWQETMEMVAYASQVHPENRSIGWDVAITEKGPELIEGNHNWCKLLWQLPVQKGLKKELESYL